MRWKSDMPDIEIVPEMSDELLQKIGEQLIKSERFRPYRIEFTPPYDKVAFYLEHGTGPATVSKKEPPRGDGKTAKQRIYAWVGSRYRSLNKVQLNMKKHDLYKQIMEAGTPPRPFIRPAIEDVLSYEHAQEVFNAGGGTAELMTDLLEAMTDYLQMNESLSADEDGDSIIHHIRAVPYKPGEAFHSDGNYSIEEIITTWKNLDDQNTSRYIQNVSRFKAMKRSWKNKNGNRRGVR